MICSPSSIPHSFQSFQSSTHLLSKILNILSTLLLPELATKIEPLPTRSRMGSCMSRCWCSCCDCGILAMHHHRQSAPISDITDASSTTMLFDSIQNPSPHHNSSYHPDPRSRSDSTIACIMKSWKRKNSLASLFQGKSSIQPGFQLRPGSHFHHQAPISSIEFETLMCDFDIPVSKEFLTAC